MDILKCARENAAYTLRIRRHLHENPELSKQEVRTVRFVCQELEQLGIPYVEVERGGVFATIAGERGGSEKPSCCARI